MNDFMDTVSVSGYGHLLELKNFKNTVPVGNDELSRYLRLIVQDNLKVMIDPDTDPDGYLSALTVKETLDELGHTNYTVNEIENKRHGITDKEVMEAINTGYDMVIIVDSSTNSMEHITKLTSNGLYVIVIDHHQTKYKIDDYPENALVINCTTQEQPKEINKLSACALTAILMNNSLTDLGKKPVKRFMLYAYITLYSDSCDLDSELNQSIIQSIDNFTNDLPEWLTMFMTSWDSINRGFVEYKLVPKINALVRMNKLYLINYLLFTEMVGELKLRIQALIEDNYIEAKELTQYLADNAEVEVYDKFIIANLDKATSASTYYNDHIRNFTGVVASRIMQLHNKTTMTLLKMGDRYEGSVRDPFNRDVLKVFKQFLKSAGHKSAFGVSMKIRDYNFVLDNLNLYDNQLTLDSTRTILIDADDTDDLEIQIRVMADYNELSGGSIPVGYLKKIVDSSCVVTAYEKYVKIKWGDKDIIAFTGNVYYNDILIIKPTVGKDRTQLLVNTVL